MRLTVVGAAPAYTRRGGASSCYLVEAGGRALVLDLGQGAFTELARYRSPESIEGILISHLHADHLVDLIPLRHYLTYEARATVRLHGPAELRQRVDAFQATKNFLSVMPGAALRPGSFELAGMQVEARHVRHIPDSYAFRISRPDAGSGLVYSGDCGNADDLLPLIQPGDTLLCEAAFGGSMEETGSMHLTARQAATAATRSGAGRLLLTHVLDEHAADALIRAAEAFKGPVAIARAGMMLEVGPVHA